MATNQANKKCCKCGVDDATEMINCELCERSEHFHCAGISNGFDIANSTWYCHQCEEEKIAANASRSSRSSSSSRRSLRLKLALEELEVRNRLRMKEIEAEKDFFKQKYELLMQMEDDEDRVSRRSVISEKTKREGLERRAAKNPSNAEALARIKSARVPVPDSEQMICSLLNGTIITPADMDITANKTVASESLPLLPPVVSVTGARPNAEICYSTPVAFTSISSQGPDCGRFQPIAGQQLSAPPVQKASMSVSYSQWDTSQVTSEGNSTSVPPATQSHAETYSSNREVVNIIQSGSLTVPRPPNEQITPWNTMGNIDQRRLQINNEQPVRFRHDLGNAFSTPGTQPMNSYPATGQYSVVHIIPPRMAPPSQPSVIWSAQHPRSTVQPVVQLSSPIVAPSASVHSAQTRPYMEPTVEVPTVGQAYAGHMPSYVVPASTPFVARGTSPYASTANDNVQGQAGPTASQIAARQVMARDLPVFSGNPEDWPIFQSSFQNSTEICGYSDAENLARLQRCLRGPALEAVRSRLLLPASVPRVIEILHKLFGKPEILINSLMKKVRNVQPPKADNLNTIIVFGLAVQNLTDHIAISGQDSHMANPMLLQELIAKLPTSLKMQWGIYKRSFDNVNLSTFNEFMNSLVDIASDLTLSIEASGFEKRVKEENEKREDRLFFHTLEDDSVPGNP